MAAVVQYVQYNKLPSLEEANQSLKTLPVDTINGPIRDVFLKFAADLTFCLYLQHRHHTVAADEAVVKVEGTAHVMDDQTMKDIVSFGNQVVPTTWMTTGNKLLPMEFAAVPGSTASPVPSAEFTQEFLSVLANNGCEGLFGIDTLAKNNWSEMKVGDASVVVASNDTETYNQDKFIPVAFAFDKEKPKFKVPNRFQAWIGGEHGLTPRCFVSSIQSKFDSTFPSRLTIPHHQYYFVKPRFTMSFRDAWPKMTNGRDFDGQNLFTLLHSGNSPFHDTWDVNLLIQEIEDNLSARVVDIPRVSNGSNNYGIHLKLSNGIDVVARLARSDVNMPDYDGFPIHFQVPEVKFEAEVYEILQSEPDILASRLLYYRVPVEHEGPKLGRPKDIAGRRLLVFQRTEGDNNVWRTLNPVQKSCLLAQAAHIRASLYKFQVPERFASVWLHKRLFEQKPESFPIPVAPTREFCVALFTSKIEATIKNIGDMIGWEDDHNTVGPIAAAAKQSLLRLIPDIIPTSKDDSILYRFVIDHGDFGIHNMSVAMDANNQPLATSLYDWETGCIVPAILSDPLMAVTVDLVTNEDALPAVTRLPRIVIADEMEQMSTWSRLYHEALFLHAPHYEHTIKIGKDARHLWFALRDWRGNNPEDYFGDLGAWAERRMNELRINQEVN